MAMYDDNGGDPIHGAGPANQDAGDVKSGVRRDVGDQPEDRCELVKKITKDVKRARAFWKDDFDRMRTDMDFLIGKQYSGQKSIDKDDRYVANITQRHVQQRTAAVYAKNPAVVARRKPMMDFKMWDENPLTAQMAMQTVAKAGQVAAGVQAGDPQAQAAAAGATTGAMQEVQISQMLLQDIQQGMTRRAAADRISKTAEIYFKNKVLAQQYPPFKAGMKQLVRRTLATGVGYGKINLVREMEMSPSVLTGMATLQEQMATVERMMADLVDDDASLTQLDAEKEELRLAIAGLQAQPMAVTQEGILFDFPTSTSIIPDWNLIHLQGFVGCEFVAEEFMFTADQVHAIWKTDVKGNYTGYAAEGTEQKNGQSKKDAKASADKCKDMCCVWMVYNRTTGLTYTVCDGYKDFLEDPCPPKFKLERFFPWFTLAFNYLEHHEQRYPLSDVHLLRHPQREYNRSREAIRQHRIANRPLTAVAAGMLDEDDVKKLQTRPDNAVVQLKALAPGQKVEDVLQPVRHPGIDPNVYETNEVFSDVLRVVGSQEANLGGTSSSTATESSIAESSRMSSLQSNMDDMDDFLTEIMRAAGQVALLEIQADEVVKVVGPGAVWPQLSNQDVADEIFMEIMAGSSGRPNKSVEVQNMTQVMPFLLQIPGLNPQWLLRQLLSRMDDRLDLTDAFLEGQPSIQTLNALAAKPLGQAPQGGGQDPNAQGDKANASAPAGPGAGGALGPQPANAAPPAPASASPVPSG